MASIIFQSTACCDIIIFTRQTRNKCINLQNDCDTSGVAPIHIDVISLAKHCRLPSRKIINFDLSQAFVYSTSTVLTFLQRFVCCCKGAISRVCRMQMIAAETLYKIFTNKYPMQIIPCLLERKEWHAGSLGVKESDVSLIFYDFKFTKKSFWL